jgi:cysteine desulfurase
MHQVYLDHAATTHVKPAVLEAMLPYLSTHYGNASSVYSLARQSKQAIEAAREQIASLISVKPQEIYFTSSGTEADNWAIKGLALANKYKGNHIVTSSVEHHAVLYSCQFLETQGFEVTYLPVDEYGLVDPSDLENAITSETILVSIMYANNEVGTIQPITELARIARDRGVIFHTDAVQALGNLNIDLSTLNVDALSMSAHKFYAPKGVGALYLKSGTLISNLFHGGSQERDLRAGTENVAGIVAMAKALELALTDLPDRQARLRELRDETLRRIRNLIPEVKLNGHPSKRLAGNLNLSFEDLSGDELLMMLDMHGIAASSGSACSALSIEASHVLLALGLVSKLAKNSLRLTFGDENTIKDVDYLLEVLSEIVGKNIRLPAR